MEAVEAAAKAAYEAYGKYLRQRGQLGKNTEMPWEIVPPLLRQAWIEAAKAVKGAMP